MPRSARADRPSRRNAGALRALALAALGTSLGCGTAELSLELPGADAAPRPEGGACHTDRDCADGTRCDAADGTCVECLTPDDCDDDALCAQGTCVECRVDADCRDELGRCVGGRCGECSQDTDCEAGVCDPRELTCEGP